MHTGVRKLKETDDNIEQTEEEADGDVKVTSDIPILVAEDTVSQVLTLLYCTLLTGIFFCEIFVIISGLI